MKSNANDSRILVLLNSLYTGGAEYSTLLFYGWLSKRGYDVRIVCCKEASPSYDPSTFGLNNATILKGSGFRFKLASLTTLINEFKPGLLHSVLFEANILGRFARFRNKNFIHVESLVNEVYSPFRLNDPNVTWLKLKGYQMFDWATQLFGVDHFHANGNSVASHYREKLRIASRRITIIPRGRSANPFLHDAETRTAIRNEFGVDDNTVVLVTVGRHEFQKGHDTLLEALAQIKTPLNYVCFIVGREGRFTSVLRDKMSTGALNDKVIFTGHRSDVARILASADAFVFPSRFEGLPGALIEAQSAGLPIVCSDIANNREVVSENENALIFPVNDSKALTEKLSVVLSDDAQRTAMGRKSLEIFQRTFQIESIHERMESLIQTLLARA